LTLGYTDKNIIEISWDNPNSVLFMKKPDNSEWILVGIVNVNSWTLQREYVYWDNFIGYRELSQSEIAEIEWDKNSVFTKVFYIDKVFLNLRAKDFYLEVYNSWSLINLDFSVVKTFNKDSFWLEFSSFDIEEIVIYEYSLVL
jgi:hypothetical protein